MASPFHHLQSEVEGIHEIANWHYADSVARLAATGFTSDDLYKIALQLDDFSMYLLTAITPTWVAVGGGGGGGPGDHEVEDAVTNAVTDVVTWTHNSAGTPAAGFGTGLLVEGETSTTPDTAIGAMSWRWEDATHATRRSSLNMYVYQGANKIQGGVINSPSVNSPLGNARGIGAVDFQVGRTYAYEVAAGAYSTLIGGKKNQLYAAAPYGVVAGGYYNWVYFGGSFGGLNNTVFGGVTIGGENNSINAGYAWSNVVLGGINNFIQSPAEHAVILAGRDANAQMWGQVVRSGGSFANQGDAQASFLTARRQVTHSGSNWYELFLDGSSFRWSLAGYKAVAFHVLLAGTNSTQSKVFGFEIKGLAKASGGVPTLMNQIVNTLYDADDTDFDARISADIPNDALLVEVRDSTSGGDNIRWHATITTTDVVHF
jgi:hypothetical protein